MPDGDVISSRLQNRWRSAYAGLKGSATLDEIAPRALKALTDLVRSNGGIAELPGYGALVEAWAAGRMTPEQARSQARLIARSQEPTRFAQIVQKAVDRLFAAPVSPAAALNPGAHTVAKVVCETTLEVELVGPACPAVVGGRFPDHDTYERFATDLRACLAPALERIADSLTQDPSAARLRATPLHRRARRPSTAEILDVSIL